MKKIFNKENLFALIFVIVALHPVIELDYLLGDVLPIRLTTIIDFLVLPFLVILATSNYRQIRTARAHDVVGTIKRMVSYITRKHKLLFIMSILGILISSLTGVVSSYFFKPIINDYIVPYIGKENPDMTGFIKMLTLMGIIYLVGVIFSYVKQKTISLMATGMLDELRTDLFNKMQNLPVSFFDKKGHGEIMVYYTNDIDMMRPMIAETFPTLLSVLVTIIGCFIVMAVSDFFYFLITQLSNIINCSKLF